MGLNTNELRGKIYGKYGSLSAFSKDVGWNRNKIGHILRGEMKPNIDECAAMANKLGLSPRDYYHIFLPDLAPFGDAENLIAQNNNQTA